MYSKYIPASQLYEIVSIVVKLIIFAIALLRATDLQLSMLLAL